MIGMLTKTRLVAPATSANFIMGHGWLSFGWKYIFHVQIHHLFWQCAKNKKIPLTQQQNDRLLRLKTTGYFGSKRQVTSAQNNRLLRVKITGYFGSRQQVTSGQNDKLLTFDIGSQRAAIQHWQYALVQWTPVYLLLSKSNGWRPGTEVHHKHDRDTTTFWWNWNRSLPASVLVRRREFFYPCLLLQFKIFNAALPVWRHWSRFFLRSDIYFLYAGKGFSPDK